MSKHFFAVAFAIGLVTVAWVGLGFVGSNWIALVMTAVIAGVYLFGASELRQYRKASAGLSAALAEIPQPLSSLGDWLERVPSTLRNAVRLRIEGERGGLPGPALTPYLVGLLVMLGMLGTFLGMVVTFKGAVFALEGSTDLQAIRSALAEPIKGLGLSFGTSVAGVAASAMLGLMSAISRRERQETGRQLDSRIATVLRPFSLVHQRQETFRALQAQAGALPQVVDKLDAMMERIERRSQQLDEQLLGRQADFHRDATLAYAALADGVGTSLKDSLAAGARAAGESITPVVESAMTQIVQESQRMREHLGDAFEQRSATLVATAHDSLARSEELVRSRAQTQAEWVDQHGQRMDQLAGLWRTEMTALREEENQRGHRLAERENLALQERTVLLEKLGALLQAVNQSSGEQRAAIEGLVASASSVLDAHAGKAADIATHVTASAVELSSLGESFSHGVQLFQATNDRLMETLQRIETSLNRSTSRSDEQLAYYVAQAREVIDLSIASQQGLVDNLRQLQGKPIALVHGARA